jgi:hypothetical protein
MSKQFKNNNTIKQRFSTWGSGAAHRRYAKINFFKTLKSSSDRYNFLFGDTPMIWGYSFDLLYASAKRLRIPAIK